jgi:glycosyltransferase involved in cell wall biosynthesis
MLTQKDLTLIIPSSNNLRHLKNAYASIKKNAPEVTIIILDDASSDGTLQWANSLVDDKIGMVYRSNHRVGHTILYDKGISFANTEVVGIMHADMILGPNYVENLLKHLERKTVVCATRVEPPLHPPGKEKIIADFGMDFDTLDISAFETFCVYADQTTNGMFAPWVIYKEDFVAMGGHDAIFAPFPYEDSDIFQRWMLHGYKLIQSRDSFVYHLTCRGHRWSEHVGIDDVFYKYASAKAGRNYLRKWGSWIENDEYQLPIIKPRYNIAYVIDNCTKDMLYHLEPWCDKIYVDQSLIEDYIKLEQPNTRLDMKLRVNPIDAPKDADVVIYLDANKQVDGGLIQNMQKILKETSIEQGTYEYENMRIEVKQVRDCIEGTMGTLINNVF